MRKDISRVKTPSPTLGKLARLREMCAPDPRPRLGLADFGERIAARALRRDSRAWRRFSLEYLMEDEAGEKAPQTVPAAGAPWNLDVLFQIYAGAEPGFVERIVERQMRLLLPRAPLRRNEADAPAAARPAAREDLPLARALRGARADRPLARDAASLSAAMRKAAPEPSRRAASGGLARRALSPQPRPESGTQPMSGTRPASGSRPMSDSRPVSSTQAVPAAQAVPPARFAPTARPESGNQTASGTRSVSDDRPASGPRAASAPQTAPNVRGSSEDRRMERLGQRRSPQPDPRAESTAQVPSPSRGEPSSRGLSPSHAASPDRTASPLRPAPALRTASGHQPSLGRQSGSDRQSGSGYQSGSDRGEGAAETAFGRERLNRARDELRAAQASAVPSLHAPGAQAFPAPAPRSARPLPASMRALAAERLVPVYRLTALARTGGLTGTLARALLAQSGTPAAAEPRARATLSTTNARGGLLGSPAALRASLAWRGTSAAAGSGAFPGARTPSDRDRALGRAARPAFPSALRIADVRQGDVFRQGFFRVEMALLQQSEPEAAPAPPAAPRPHPPLPLGEALWTRWAQALALPLLSRLPAGKTARGGVPGRPFAADGGMTESVRERPARAGISGDAGGLRSARAGIPDAAVWSPFAVRSPAAVRPLAARRESLRGEAPGQSGAMPGTAAPAPIGAPGVPAGAGTSGANGGVAAPLIGWPVQTGSAGGPGRSFSRGGAPAQTGLPAAGRAFAPRASVSAAAPAPPVVLPPRIASVRRGDVFRQSVFRMELALLREGAPGTETAAAPPGPARPARALAEALWTRWALPPLSRRAAARDARMEPFGAARSPQRAVSSADRISAAPLRGEPLPPDTLSGVPAAERALGRSLRTAERTAEMRPVLREIWRVAGGAASPGLPPRIASVRQGDVFRQSIFRTELALAQESASEAGGGMSAPAQSPVRAAAPASVGTLLTRWAQALLTREFRYADALGRSAPARALPPVLAAAPGKPAAARITPPRIAAVRQGDVFRQSIFRTELALAQESAPEAGGGMSAPAQSPARAPAPVGTLLTRWAQALLTRELRHADAPGRSAPARALPPVPVAAPGRPAAARIAPPRIAAVRQGDVFWQSIFRTELALAQENAPQTGSRAAQTRPLRTLAAAQANTAPGLAAALRRGLERTAQRAEALHAPSRYAPLRPALRDMHSRARRLRTAVEGQAAMTRLVHSPQERAQHSALELIAQAGEGGGGLRASILTQPAEIVMLVPPTYMNAYGAPAPRVGNLSWGQEAAGPDRSSGRAAVELLRRAQQKFGAPARYRPPEMVLKERGEATGRLASQSAPQAPSINQEMRARRRVEEKARVQDLSPAEITRIVDKVYRKLESRIATEYRRRGL